MTVLIGLNGFKGSGKNTAGNFIQHWGESRGLVVVQRGFADYLKLSAARSLGLATNMNDAVVLMDALKFNGDLLITIPGQTIMRDITGREFLKWYGTEGHRDVFGEDFWVDVLLPIDGPPWDRYWREFAMYGKNPQELDLLEQRGIDIAVVTDVRFVNEAVRIKQLGGAVWNIDRGNWSDDEHASEQPLPEGLIDLTIENKSTLEALEINVNSEMTCEFHMRFVETPDLDIDGGMDGPDGY